MTFCNFNLPLDLPFELAIDAVSDYSPTPAPFVSKQPVADPGCAALDVLLAKLSDADLPGVEQLKEYLAHQYRRNFRPRTLRNTSIGVTRFLRFLQAAGRSRFSELRRVLHCTADTFVLLLLTGLLVFNGALSAYGLLIHHGNLSSKKSQDIIQ